MGCIKLRNEISQFSSNFDKMIIYEMLGNNEYDINVIILLFEVIYNYVMATGRSHNNNLV